MKSAGAGHPLRPDYRRTGHGLTGGERAVLSKRSGAAKQNVVERAGRAQDNARARDALTKLGLNPLMVEAFRDRSGTGTP